MKKNQNAFEVQLDETAKKIIELSAAEEVFPALSENITDNGTKHKYTNGKPADGTTFKPGKDAGMPTAPPPGPIDSPLINLSSEKPTFSELHFSTLRPGSKICGGVAYYARNGYNRHAIGVPKRFVAFMGGGGESWAIYVGSILQSEEVIGRDGEKVLLEAHIQQLIDCEETLPYYRF